MIDASIPIAIAVIAVLLLALGAVLDDRRSRVRRREQAAGLDIETVLPLLHSINDDRCIGCEACIDVCPTEVLDLVNHKVAVSRFSDCVQCEQCAVSCPTQALVMYRVGTTPRTLTVPELDENFQTGVIGQYLIGEVAGKPLVKNAANLGRAVIEHIRRELSAEPEHRDVLDVVIVGSGPAGLSAGLTCVRYGLRCQVLEKEHLISSTVARYPKGKHFMAEPVGVENVSLLPVFDGTKEALIAAWERLAATVALPIRLGEAVESVIRGDDGLFTIKTTVATYRARRVVLATGLRGKPRLLAVPGANLEKVESLLDDPAPFANHAVLVVGGGDSAIEGAMALAAAGATVTLSYRGDSFKRAKQANQRALAAMVEDGQLVVHLESNVREFTEHAVTLVLASKQSVTIPNHRAFVLIGADTPVAWLEANAVRFIERPHLYALGSTEEVVRRIVPDVLVCADNIEAAASAVRGHVVPTGRSLGSRMRSVVGHVREELHHAVTEVSAAFRLSDLEDARKRARTATPVSGVSHHVISRRTRPVPFIPAARLTATNVKEDTVTTVNPFGDPVRERTNIDGRPLRPRTSHDTRTQTRALPVFGKRVPLPTPQPRAIPHRIPDLPASEAGIAGELEDAFSRAFGEPEHGKPNPFSDDDTVLERERLRVS